MNTTDLQERLRALPPELPDQPSRYATIQGRVRRRRRRQAVVSIVGVAAAAIAAPIFIGALGQSEADGDRGVDPAVDRTSETADGAGEIVQPGADEVTLLSDPVTRDGTGPTTVDLGPHPTGATAVQASLTCLTEGTLIWPDGASMQCGAGDDIGSTATTTVKLNPTTTEFTLRGGPDVAWRLEATYVRVEHTDWKVNANGETYGVVNDRGEPDLIAAVATNGREGYVRSADLNGSAPASPADAAASQDSQQTQELPVFDSDGQTVIGEFAINRALQQ